MVLLDAAVDDSDDHATASGDAVQVGQTPGGRDRLHGEQGIVIGGRGGGLGLIDVHRFGPGDLGIAGDAPHGALQGLLGRHAHHVAIDPEQGHLPAVADELQAVSTGDLLGQAAARRDGELVAVFPTIGGVRPVMVRRNAEHHQDLAPAGSFGRRGGRRRRRFGHC